MRFNNPFYMILKYIPHLVQNSQGRGRPHLINSRDRTGPGSESGFSGPETFLNKKPHSGPTRAKFPIFTKLDISKTFSLFYKKLFQ